MIHYLSHIKENNALSKLSDGILREILSFAKVKTCVPKEKVLKELGGDDNFYFIVKGLVKAFFVENNEQFCSRFFTPGEILMDFKSVFYMNDFPLEFECITHVTIVHINKSTFHKLMEEHASLKYIYIESMAADLLKYEERVRLLLCNSGKDRYQKFVEQFGLYISCFSQKDVASYLAMKPETLSRVKRSISY